MRRQFGKFFPAIMIAMWVQIFAPVGAYWTMAADPFGSASICSPSAAHQPGETGPGQSQPHQNCCDLCIVSQSGSAPLSPPASAVAEILRSPETVVWHAQRHELISDPRGSPEQARAPPFIS